MALFRGLAKAVDLSIHKIRSRMANISPWLTPDVLASVCPLADPAGAGDQGISRYSVGEAKGSFGAPKFIRQYAAANRRFRSRCASGSVA